MSADNTIVILKSPKDDDFEYRVLHCQGVDNIYWNDEKEDYDDEPYAPNLIEYFQACDVMNNETDAFKIACDMDQRVSYVEYGIRVINLPRPFDWYRDHAKRIRNSV